MKTLKDLLFDVLDRPISNCDLVIYIDPNNLDNFKTSFDSKEHHSGMVKLEFICSLLSSPRELSLFCDLFSSASQGKGNLIFKGHKSRYNILKVWYLNCGYDLDYEFQEFLDENLFESDMYFHLMDSGVVIDHAYLVDTFLNENLPKILKLCITQF